MARNLWSSDLMNHEHEDEEPDAESLVFPVNVHESLQASGGLKKGEKVGILVSFWIAGCGILAWVLAGWLRTVIPSWYGWATLLVEVLLQLTVGVYILRFALDERALFVEMNKADLSFANYFKIYREITAKDGSRFPFDMLEFDDGSYGIFIECRLGHNTQVRSTNTYYVNHQVINMINKAGLKYKVYYRNEAFKSSQAAQDLRDIVGGITDPALFSVYRDIVQNYLNIAENESNVLCITYLVYAQTRVEKDEFLSVMNNVFTTYEREDTVYRQVKALRYDDIVEFLRNYYQLEVIDMGLIRAHIAEKKNKYSCPVSILKIYGTSGKAYVSPGFQKLSKDLVANQGLVPVNKR